MQLFPFVLLLMLGSSAALSQEISTQDIVVCYKTVQQDPCGTDVTLSRGPCGPQTCVFLEEIYERFYDCVQTTGIGKTGCADKPCRMREIRRQCFDGACIVVQETWTTIVTGQQASGNFCNAQGG